MILYDFVSPNVSGWSELDSDTQTSDIEGADMEMQRSLSDASTTVPGSETVLLTDTEDEGGLSTMTMMTMVTAVLNLCPHFQCTAEDCVKKYS